MNSHTAMVGHWSGHRSHSCDDTCRRIVTENSICGFSIFPSSTQDIDFTITNRHTTVFLFNQIYKKKKQTKNQLTIEDKRFDNKLKKHQHALTQYRRGEVLERISLWPSYVMSVVWWGLTFTWMKWTLLYDEGWHSHGWSEHCCMRKADIHMDEVRL